jgi:hypothetical protein
MLCHVGELNVNRYLRGAAGKILEVVESQRSPVSPQERGIGTSFAMFLECRSGARRNRCGSRGNFELLPSCSTNDRVSW